MNALLLWLAGESVLTRLSVAVVSNVATHRRDFKVAHRRFARVFDVAIVPHPTGPQGLFYPS